MIVASLWQASERAKEDMDYLTHDGQRQETLKAIQSLRFKYALARLYDEEVVEI